MHLIINPVEKIKMIIPELRTADNYSEIKTISNQSWCNRMKTIETKNLNKFKKSLIFSGLERYFNPCIIYLDAGNSTITFNTRKYKLIKEYLMSDEFNKGEIYENN